MPYEPSFEVPTPEDAPRFFTQLMAQGLAQGMGHTYVTDWGLKLLEPSRFRSVLEK